jgi:hypothetical protein
LLRQKQPALAAKHGVQFTYSMAARGQIFRRDAGGVVDLSSLRAIMRSNDYKNDPVSHGNPMRAICSRNDLNPGGVPEGCYDTKVTVSVARFFCIVCVFFVYGSSTQCIPYPSFISL